VQHIVQVTTYCGSTAATISCKSHIIKALRIKVSNQNSSEVISLVSGCELQNHCTFTFHSQLIDEGDSAGTSIASEDTHKPETISWE